MPLLPSALMAPMLFLKASFLSTSCYFLFSTADLLKLSASFLLGVKSDFLRELLRALTMMLGDSWVCQTCILTHGCSSSTVPVDHLRPTPDFSNVSTPAWLPSPFSLSSFLIFIFFMVFLTTRCVYVVMWSLSVSLHQTVSWMMKGSLVWLTDVAH